MKKSTLMIILVTMTILLVSNLAMAGGRYYRGAHHYSGGHHGHYNPGYRHGGYYAGAALGGLIVGGIIGASINPPVYQRPVYVYSNPIPVNVGTGNTFMLNSSGDCFLVTETSKGNKILSSVPVRNCR